MGEGIAETGSDRRTEVPDCCGALPYPRIFGIFLGFFSLKSARMSKPQSAGQFRFYLDREPLSSFYLCDAAFNSGIMAMNARNHERHGK
jgi:hypothetical protein